MSIEDSIQKALEESIDPPDPHLGSGDPPFHDPGRLGKLHMAWIDTG